MSNEGRWAVAASIISAILVGLVSTAGSYFLFSYKTEHTLKQKAYYEFVEQWTDYEALFAEEYRAEHVTSYSVGDYGNMDAVKKALAKIQVVGSYDVVVSALSLVTQTQLMQLEHLKNQNTELENYLKGHPAKSYKDFFIDNDARLAADYQRDTAKILKLRDKLLFEMREDLGLKPLLVDAVKDRE